LREPPRGRSRQRKDHIVAAGRAGVLDVDVAGKRGDDCGALAAGAMVRRIKRIMSVIAVQ
jgi:hypothetical protein